MNSLRGQSGASPIVWLVFLALLVFSGLIAVKLFPVYLNSYTVKTIVDDIAIDSKSNTRNPNLVWSFISKRLDINGINDVKREHFELVNEKGGKSLISINYEVRKPMFYNVDAVIKVSHSAEIKQSDDNP